MLHEVQGTHIVQWVDALKMNMVTNWFKAKKDKRLYEVLREELLVAGGVTDKIRN